MRIKLKLLLFFFGLVTLIALYAQMKCRDNYKKGGRSGHDGRSEREERDRKEDRKLEEEENPRSIFTEQEIADLKSGMVGGKLNCTVCVPCLNPIKACHSLCRQCNSVCQPSSCNIKPKSKANILNSITDSRLRKQDVQNQENNQSN